ncbi:MAG: AHH domain-containing protein [Betaproteobacteria bacterium]|nr:AHH domain-containing protein [Betaproteobacteria bacterium]
MCTDKNCVSAEFRGPWTPPEFRKMFDKAGLSMQDGLNKVWVAGHQGPHPAEYREVFRRLTCHQRTNGDAYSSTQG